MTILLGSHASAINTDDWNLLVDFKADTRLTLESELTTSLTLEENTPILMSIYEQNGKHMAYLACNGTKTLEQAHSFSKYPHDINFFRSLDFVRLAKEMGVHKNPSNAFYIDENLPLNCLSQSSPKKHQRFVTNCEILHSENTVLGAIFLLQPKDVFQKVFVSCGADGVEYVEFSISDLDQSNPTPEQLVNYGAKKIYEVIEKKRSTISTQNVHYGNENKAVKLKIENCDKSQGVESINIHANILCDQTVTKDGITNRAIGYFNYKTECMEILQLTDSGNGFYAERVREFKHIVCGDLAETTLKPISSVVREALYEYLKLKGINRPELYIGTLHPNYIAQNNSTISNAESDVHGEILNMVVTGHDSLVLMRDSLGQRFMYVQKILKNNSARYCYCTNKDVLKAIHTLESKGDCVDIIQTISETAISMDIYRLVNVQYGGFSTGQPT